MDTVMRGGMPHHRVICELVYGTREKDPRSGDMRIIGETYHVLTGPTAEASVSSYAEDLNMRQVPPSKAPAFGKPLKDDPNQMSLLLMGNFQSKK